MKSPKNNFIENLNFDQNTTDFLHSILNRAKKCDSLAYQFLGRLQADCNYFLGYGDDLEILEPKDIRNDFKIFLNNILNRYR